MIESQCAAQSGLKLVILLPQSGIIAITMAS